MTTTVEPEAPAAPAHSDTAIRLFERAIGATWRRGPIPTALDILESDLRPMGAWHSPRMPAPAERSKTEAPLVWTRQLTSSELRRQCVVSFDKHAAYLGVLGGLELGVSEPAYNDWTGILKDRQSDELDTRRPGYWRVRCEFPPIDPAFPDLLRRRAGVSDHWVTTPTLELALENGYEVRVLESYTWPIHRRVLRKFGDRCRMARELLTRTANALDDADCPLAAGLAEAAGMVKSVYAPVLGGFLARYADRALDVRPPWYRPDWRHHIIAKARANLLRNLIHWRAYGLEPIGIYNDAFYVASDYSAEALSALYGLPIGDKLSDYAADEARELAAVVKDGRLNWRLMWPRDAD